MTHRELFKLRMSIGSLSVLVLLLTLGFNILLSVSTLDRLAVASLLSGYQGAGEHVVLGIERGLRFGKPLSQFAGMTEVLADLRDGVGNISRVDVIDAQGDVLYTVPQSNNTPGHDPQRRQFDAARLLPEASPELSHYTGPSTYRIVLPIKHNGIKGGLALEITKDTIDASSTEFVHWAMLLLAVAGITVCVALAGWVGLLTSTPEARHNLRRSLGVLLVVLVGGTQLAYSAAMLTLFQSFMHKAVRDKAAVVAHFIQRDFEYIIHKGVDVRVLKGGEDLLNRVVETHRELCGASLIDSEGNILAKSGRIDPKGSTVERSVDAFWPSRFRQRVEVMRVQLHTDSTFVSSSVRSLGLDLATTLGMSLLFLMELAKLLGLISVRMLRSTGESESALTDDGCSAKALRAAGFLFFLGYDMCISFVPLLARELPAPDWGFSDQIMAGLPISAEMTCAGLALLGAGLLSERLGWRMAYVLGAISAAIGLALGGTAESLTVLIAARGISGFGFGLALMASQIGTLEGKQAGAGIADVFAGVFAGSICGSAAGAMLAERLGFQEVLFVAASLVPMAMLALGAAGHSRQSGVHNSGEFFPPPGASWRFLRDPRMHLLLAFIGLPTAMCLTGFLHYLLPLRLNEVQVSQSDIGRLFMLYGLCFITIGPILGRWVDRITHKETGAMLTGLLCGVALLMVATSLTLSTAAMAVLAVGVAQCLAAPSTMLCVVSLASAHDLGRAKTASLYRSLERVGQVLGPILCGAILVHVEATTALYVAGSILCVMAILFKFIWRVKLSA